MIDLSIISYYGYDYKCCLIL